jgi:hypothetical protein
MIFESLSAIFFQNIKVQMKSGLLTNRRGYTSREQEFIRSLPASESIGSLGRQNSEIMRMWRLHEPGWPTSCSENQAEEALKAEEYEDATPLPKKTGRYRLDGMAAVQAEWKFRIVGPVSGFQALCRVFL